MSHVSATRQNFSGKNGSTVPTTQQPISTPEVVATETTPVSTIETAVIPSQVNTSSSAGSDTSTGSTIDTIPVDESIDDIPPSPEKDPPTEEELEFALWRAILHLRNLEDELDLLLRVPKTAGPLRRAAAAEKCQIPGNVCNWSVIKTIQNVTQRVVKEVSLVVPK